MSTGSACGKIILFGEHAVVYGRPALAVPLSQLRAFVTVQRWSGVGTVIHARDLGRDIVVETEPDDPLATAARLTMQAFGVTDNLEITVKSEIPVASGLGSGAAISTAIVRALADYFGKSCSAEQVSSLVFETEKIYHGTPSGLDNTVIAHERAVRYVKGKETVPFSIACPFTLLIANTGISSPTKITVGDVRRAWEQDPDTYERMFDEVGAIVEEAQVALADGENERLGELMARNQRVLERLGVSSPEIEQLIAAGLRAGAAGGKLSGGGRGGNVIFYLPESKQEQVVPALIGEGAVNIIRTNVR